MIAITTHKAAPTGAITLPTQFTTLRNAPSGWAAVWPWTALLVAGAPPRFGLRLKEGRVGAQRLRKEIWLRIESKGPWISETYCLSANVILLPLAERAYDSFETRANSE